MAEYIFTREFWSLDHPKVVLMATGTMTDEQFVKGIRPEDPFMVMKVPRSKDSFIVVGYDEKEVQRRDEEIRRHVRESTARTGGMPPSTVDTDRELIETNFPGSTPIYAKIDDMECKECKGGLKNRILAEMFASCKEKPRPDLVDKFKTKLTENAVKLLSGETPTVEETKVATPFSKMAKVGRIKRTVLFSCPIVCQGSNEEICRKCRSDASFRKELVKYFEVPPTFQVKKGNDESYMVGTIPSPYETYNFSCPYKQEVENKFPSVAKMASNAATAGLRVLRAFIGGKDVLVPKELLQSREKMCMECPKHEAASHRCYECGCYLDYKLPLSTEKCPLGKW